MTRTTRTLRTTALLTAAALGAGCTRHEAPIAADQTPDEARVAASGVVYRAQTAVLESFPVQLRTVVTAENRGRQPVTLTSGGCEAFLVAYRRPDRSGTPAWDQRYAIACTKILKRYPLAPGDSTQLRAGASAADILGDSLPNGRYYLSVVPATDEKLAVPAGEAQLDVPPKR